MSTHPELPPVIGAVAADRNGDALGTVTAVFLDDRTNRPTWVGLTDGLHAAADGDTPVIAPIDGSEFADGRLRLGVSGDSVRTAPRLASGDRLTGEAEDALRRHYAGTATSGTAGLAAPGTAGDGMTRSEERLSVATVVEPWTRAVLRIEEVTEEVMVPVTITRQRAVIDHLPLAAGTARDGDVPDRSGDGRTSGWITLFSEKPVVSLERVPVERARMVTSWVTDQQTVTEQVRHEEIALEDGTPTS